MAASVAPWQAGLARRSTPTARAVASLKWLLDSSETALLGAGRAAAAAGPPAAAAADVAWSGRR